MDNPAAKIVKLDSTVVGLNRPAANIVKLESTTMRKERTSVKFVILESITIILEVQVYQFVNLAKPESTTMFIQPRCVKHALMVGFRMTKVRLNARHVLI